MIDDEITSIMNWWIGRVVVETLYGRRLDWTRWHKHVSSGTSKRGATDDIHTQSDHRKPTASTRDLHLGRWYNAQMDIDSMMYNLIKKKSSFNATNRAHPSGHFQSHGGDWWLPCRLPIRSTIKMHDSVWFATEGCQACSTTWNRSRSHLVKHWGSWSLAWLALATYVVHKNHCHQRFRYTLFAMQHWCWLSWCRPQWVALWWIN